MHRAQRWRHVAPAPQGASAPLRYPAGKPAVLLHDAGVDDVELAGLGARQWRDALPLRWLAWLSRGAAPVRYRRGRACNAFRDIGGLPRTAPQNGRRPWTRARPRGASDDPLDRLALIRGRVRIRLPVGQGGRAPGVDLRRHGYRVVLRSRGTDLAGLCRRDPGTGPRDGGRRLRRDRPAAAGRQGRARLHAKLSVDAARLLG